MKYCKHSLLILICCLSTYSWSQEGIGTNNPNPSTALDIDVVDKGLLIPRLGLTAANSFAPVTGTASTAHNGMIVYNTNTTISATNSLTGVGFYVWQGGATGEWLRLTTTQDADSQTDATRIIDADSDTQIQLEEGPDDDTIRFDTAETERAVITATGNVGIGTASPVASAIVEMESTTQGLLPPRMTEFQMHAIATPAVALMVYCLDCDEGSGLYVYDGSYFINIVSGVASVPSIRSASNRIWMDRNLGATRVATFATDAAAYGDLYQWGRTTDGHQVRTSPTAAGPVASGSEGNDFVLNGTTPYDWLSTQDNSRWEATKTANDPCPSGYRVPTDAELNTERQLFSPSNAEGAYASELKLPLAGGRNSSTGALANVGSRGLYWSSTSYGTRRARNLTFNSSSANVVDNNRAYGFSVRCIKEQ